MQSMSQSCLAMKTATVSMKRATISSSKTPVPESGGSASEDKKQQQLPMQESAPAELPQCVGGNAVNNDCHKSALDTKLASECEFYASSSKETSAESEGACNSVTIGSTTYDSLNKQSVESSQVTQAPKASTDVTISDTNQNGHHDTTTLDNERKLTGAVRKRKSKTKKKTTTTTATTNTTTTTTTTTTTSSSSHRCSHSSSISGGADIAGWNSRSDSECGADGDIEETDTTRSRTSFDLDELRDYLNKRIEEEKEKEESLMGEIKSWMESVSSMSDNIRSYVLDVFGTHRVKPHTSRKSSRDHTKGKHSVVQEEVTRGSDGDFERRLQAVKIYLDDGSDEPEAIPEAKAETEEEASTVPVPEEVASCSTSSNIKQVSGISCSGEVAECRGDKTPAVINRKEECRGRVAEFLRQQSNDEIIRKRQAARKSWDNQMVVKICDNAEQRILAGKFNCRRMLRCMKSLAVFVSLAMDAYTATEMAMQKARKCRMAPAGDILQAIKTAAAEMSDRMWMALRHAEAAVTIHAEVVEAIERAERSLIAVHSENTVGDNVMNDVTAAVEHLKMLIPRTRVFGSSAPQRGEQAPSSTSDTPRVACDLRFRSSRVSDDVAGFQCVPATVVQNVLAAAKSSVEAVGATARALSFFSTCDWCTGRKVRKRRGCIMKIEKDEHFKY